jgi:hypothetical protein
VKIYRKLWFFNDFGAFNRAGKTVTKIGIYSKPPPKRWIYSVFYKIGLKIDYLYHFFNILIFYTEPVFPFWVFGIMFAI